MYLTPSATATALKVFPDLKKSDIVITKSESGELYHKNLVNSDNPAIDYVYGVPSNCAHLSKTAVFSNNTHKTVTYRCKSQFCKSCVSFKAKEDGKKVLSVLSQAQNKKHHIYMAVKTFPNQKTIDSKFWTKINLVNRKVNQYLKAKKESIVILNNKIKGEVIKKEVTTDPMNKEYNAHLQNILITSKVLTAFDIITYNKLFVKAYKSVFETKIAKNPVHFSHIDTNGTNEKHLAKEVAKYTAKSSAYLYKNLYINNLRNTVRYYQLRKSENKLMKWSRISKWVEHGDNVYKAIKFEIDMLYGMKNKKVIQFKGIQPIAEEPEPYVSSGVLNYLIIKQNYQITQYKPKTNPIITVKGNEITDPNAPLFQSKVIRDWNPDSPMEVTSTSLNDILFKYFANSYIDDEVESSVGVGRLLPAVGNKSKVKGTLISVGLPKQERTRLLLQMASTHQIEQFYKTQMKLANNKQLKSPVEFYEGTTDIDFYPDIDKIVINEQELLLKDLINIDLTDNTNSDILNDHPDIFL